MWFLCWTVLWAPKQCWGLGGQWVISTQPRMQCSTLQLQCWGSLYLPQWCSGTTRTIFSGTWRAMLSGNQTRSLCIKSMHFLISCHLFSSNMWVFSHQKRYLSPSILQFSYPNWVTVIPFSFDTNSQGKCSCPQDCINFSCKSQIKGLQVSGTSFQVSYKEGIPLPLPPMWSFNKTTDRT